MKKRILNVNNIRKTVNYLRKNGVKHAYYAAMERIEEEKKSDYIYEEPPKSLLLKQKEASKKLPYKFSIVVPAYETKEEYLRELIDSVLYQSYENWELIIADASLGDRVEKVVSEYLESRHPESEYFKSREKRIKYIKLTENKGISENTNAGIREATGDYIALLDHDDLITADALYEIANVIQTKGAGDNHPILLYSDEDKYDGKNVKEPHIKSEFNLDLILSNNYICHLMVVEADCMKKLMLRGEYDGAQDYDLVLRVVSGLMDRVDIQKLKENIIHVPKVLYHWRCHRDSTAENTASKSYAYEAGKRALEDFCNNRNWQVQVSHALHLGFYRIEYIPDMFTVRPDVGIIGGSILDKYNKITSGMYNKDGERVYRGLHKEYSGGSTHKASLVQECAAVDIRCMRLRSELQPIFEKITGVSYKENEKLKLADVSAISCDEEGYKKLSMELCKAVEKNGYLVVWNPEIKRRFNK
ncbi:MAG: glycosyltransferase [Lachnospiraceae bacterium]|nr:glycosyltransferase [Lachnospiraceae bacterium]